jgi:phosphoserine phosphatase RsbU/P
MQILVSWDDITEADTIALFLNAGENAARVTTDAAEFLDAVKRSWWDVIVMPLAGSAEGGAAALFEKIRQIQPHTPIVGAAHARDTYALLHFLARGLHAYLVRDNRGEFIFFLPHVIERAHASAQAERTRQVAEQLQQEIESVRRLQKSLIPRQVPMPPGYAVAGRYEPSQIEMGGSQPLVLAGGDYYDLFPVGHGRVAFVVCDAAGHGIRACLSIMVLHALMRQIHDQNSQTTAQFMAAVNTRLCESDIIQASGGFITMLYGILDTGRHVLQWTSAGHPVPLLQRFAANEVAPVGSCADAGPPLGISPHLAYEAQTLEMPEGSRLLLYTDGLTEALPEGDPDQQFGLDGITLTLRATAKLHVDEALDMLFVASAAFTGGKGRHDDTSAILVERKALEMS